VQCAEPLALLVLPRDHLASFSAEDATGPARAAERGPPRGRRRHALRSGRAALHAGPRSDPGRLDFPREWLATYETGRRDGTREAFAALDGGGRFVGLGLAFGIDRTEGEAELGYIVASEARGRGLGTAILRALTDWAFAETGVQRLQLFVDVENPASLRVAERSGYVREGVMRSVHVKNGRRIDAVVLSRLPTDPEPLP
jgi:RimJ/RimL family protein N-acetyltransferase